MDLLQERELKMKVLKDHGRNFLSVYKRLRWETMEI